MKKLLLIFAILSLVGCGKTRRFHTAITPPSSIPPSVAALFPAYSPVVHTCGYENFSGGFSLGSVHLQDGWFADPSASFNQTVTTDAACSGSQSWFLNSDVGSSAFGNQPQSFQFPKTAGESTVSNGGGDTMEVSFFIKTKSSSGDL